MNNKNKMKQTTLLKLNSNYLDYDQKGWTNISGYGNIVNSQLPNINQRLVQTMSSPWDRLQPLPAPYHIENTQYSWSPPLTPLNKSQLYQTCAICPTFDCQANQKK